MLVASLLLLSCSSCAVPRGGSGETYSPYLDHITFEKMQRVRGDEATGKYQEALNELLQIAAQGDFPKPAGADAPWAISPASPQGHQLQLWEDHQNQLSSAREMIGDIYAEGRLGMQDLPQAVKVVREGRLYGWRGTLIRACYIEARIHV
jgi:hypothetical protein